MPANGTWTGNYSTCAAENHKKIKSETSILKRVLQWKTKKLNHQMHWNMYVDGGNLI
jgi:hypothetical protein